MEKHEVIEINEATEILREFKMLKSKLENNNITYLESGQILEQANKYLYMVVDLVEKNKVSSKNLKDIMDIEHEVLTSCKEIIWPGINN